MEAIVGLVLVGLVIGALARLALPGPDPMPIWATVLLGVVGAVVGGMLGIAVGAGNGSFLISVIVSTLVLFLYRRLVQKRPITGPGARRAPSRAARGRDELRPAERLERLRELREAGLITEEEFELKRREAVERL